MAGYYAEMRGILERHGGTGAPWRKFTGDAATGDAVNVAARLEQLAPPGDVRVTRFVVTSTQRRGRVG